MTLRRSGYGMLLRLAVGLSAVFVTACRSTTEPVLDPGIVAGTYVLDSVTTPRPDSPLTGTMVLTSDGQATRRVRYRDPASGAPTREYVAVGTFRLVRPDGIDFTLRADAGQSPYVWPLRGERFAALFTLSYPSAADGEVVETYRRQAP